MRAASRAAWLIAMVLSLTLVPVHVSVASQTSVAERQTVPAEAY